jgi:GT2 family glycosyltransferase
VVEESRLSRIANPLWAPEGPLFKPFRAADYEEPVSVPVLRHHSQFSAWIQGCSERTGVGPVFWIGPDPADKGSSLDLEDPAALEHLESRIWEDCQARTRAAAPLLCVAELVGSLHEPRPLFRTVRRLLSRLEGSSAAFAVPADKWPEPSFSDALEVSGFRVEEAIRFPGNVSDWPEVTACRVSCDPAFKRGWRAALGLPEETRRLQLLMPPEPVERMHSAASLLQASETLLGEQQLVLMVSAPDGPAQEHWISLEALHPVTGALRVPVPRTADVVLEAVQHLLFLCDDIQLIQFPDTGGVGHRVAQAKRAGLLPPSVRVLGMAQGGVLLNHRVHAAVPNQSSLEAAVCERLSLELADRVAFPSRRLQQAYVEDFGYRPRESLLLPIPRASLPATETVGTDVQSIRRLVFLGSVVRDRGLPMFAQACALLFSEPRFADARVSLSAVSLVGRSSEEASTLNLPVPVAAWSWDELFAAGAFRDLARDSLLVVCEPLWREPRWLQAALEGGCGLMVLSGGVLDELLPEDSRAYLHFDGGATGLAEALADAIRRTPEGRRALMARVLEQYRELLAKDRETYRRALGPASERPVEAVSEGAAGSVTVVIPTLNGKTERLRPVAAGLVAQKLAPAEVLIVDDGSSETGFRQIEAAVPGFGHLPVRIIRHPVNQGLSAARNTGLAQVSTPYMCLHDDDDIMHPRMLAIACGMLDANPDVAAVTTWNRYFTDQAEQFVLGGTDGIRVIGADLGLGLRTNCFGPSMAVYRCDVLRRLGGWNTDSRALFEDWECFYRLAEAGYGVWVVPHELALYRIDPRSMSRSHSDFEAWLRMANVAPLADRAASLSLLQAVQLEPPRITAPVTKSAPPESRLRRFLGKVRGA